MVDVIAELEAPVAPEELFAWVEDLARYPAWLDIVPRAEPVDPIEGDPGPAWSVDLRGRLGPLARSKRLRMVQREIDAPNKVVFERCEHDGRQHSPWILTADVQPGGAGASTLRMHLHYGGGLFGRPLEVLLRQEIEHSRTRLLALLA